MKNRKVRVLMYGMLGSLLFGNVGSAVEMVRENESITSVETEEFEPTYDSEEWIDSEGIVDYPVDIFDDEWKDLQTYEEMLEACTIPDDILQQMTTEQLLDLFLNSPLLCNIYAFDTIQEGLVEMYKTDNGLQALFDRQDLSSVLLNRYQACTVGHEKESAVEGFYDTSEVIILEALLAQNEVVSQLDKNERKELLEEVKDKMTEKNNDELYNGEESTFYDVVLANDLDEELQLCIDTKIINKREDVVCAATTTTYVKTPKGTKVTVYKYDDMSANRKKEINAAFKKDWPNATYLSTATKKYNCHSYAWYKQSTSNAYWMNSPKQYVSDKSYKYVGINATAKGQKIVYKYQKVPVDSWIHSGVVSTSKSPFLITSKWGQAPLMQHAVLYCPYVSQSNAFHYYTKN